MAAITKIDNRTANILRNRKLIEMTEAMKIPTIWENVKAVNGTMTFTYQVVPEEAITCTIIIGGKKFTRSNINDRVAATMAFSDYAFESVPVQAALIEDGVTDDDDTEE